MRPRPWATSSAGATASMNTGTLAPARRTRQMPPAAPAAMPPQAPRPDREHAPPVRRDIARRGDIEVDPRADDAGRHRPDRHVGDQVRVTALRFPAPPGDEYRQRYPDDVHQPVDVNERRADMKPADRRAGNVQGHGPEGRPVGEVLSAAGWRSASVILWLAEPGNSADRK